MRLLDIDDEALTGAMHIDARAEEHPCTASQQQFWALDQLTPGDPALNVAVRWRLQGEVSAALLEQALQAIVARHETLRTGFAETADGVVQRVLPKVALRLQQADVSTCPDPDADAERFALGEAQRPFDLRRPPLLRAALLRLGPGRHHLLITIHHAVSDGWSIGVLARETAEFYETLRSGQGAEASSALPRPAPLALQYGDYARWQEAWLASSAPDAAAAYWQGQLAGVPYFEVPSDRPRPAVATSNGHIVSVLLPRPLTDALQALARRHGATLFMLLHAAAAAMLSRWTGEESLALGTQVANRDEAELEGLVGVFINTLVLRADLAEDPSFAELLAQSRRTVIAAMEHRQLPISRVLELMRPTRDASRRNPLFSVNVTVHRDFIQPAATGDFTLSSIPSVSPGAIYDLNFFLVEREADGWRVSLEYNTDLFDEATARQLLGCLRHVFQAVAQDPNQRVSALPLLDPAESHALIDGLNQTARPYPAEASLPQLIRDQAARTPDAVAARCGNRALTYAALDAQANQLARVLARRGVQRGQRIGVGVGRSLDMLVALLGILKAGAALVPLDPSFPAARRAQAVEDATPVFILVDTTEGSPSTPAPSLGAPTLALPTLLAEAAAEPPTPPETGPNATDLAYVIYTSGSTGRPKGVMVSHRSLVNELWQFRETLGLAPEDVVLSIITLSFDPSLLELFLPLLVGASVVIAEDADLGDPARLVALLRRSRATVLQATPALWSLLLEAGWNGNPRLRLMLVGGETLSRNLANALLARGDALWNLYGPTETTVWACAWQVPPGDGPIRIGGPIGNLRFHVLDRHATPMPMGAAGELWIGGDGVAMGYIAQPALTEERFRADPFSKAAGARLYRTGDLVRRIPGGALELLGRADHQVKINGVRIEPGEVEAALLTSPEVGYAVVIAREDRPGDRRLVGYVTPARGAALPPDVTLQLKARLARLLPSSMVPDFIVAMASLPYTPTGKVDRRALPAPVAPLVTAPAAPTDGLEAQIAGIWHDLLGVRPSPTDNFFDLGGHSLLAARMLLRLRNIFGAGVTMAALFRAPTIRELAPLVRGAATAQEDMQVVRVQPLGARTPIIAINNTGIFHRLSRHLGNDQPLLAVQALDRDMPPESFPTVFSDIAARYVAAVRRAQPAGPYVLLGLCSAGQLAWEIAHQLREAGEEIRLLALIDAWAPNHHKQSSLRQRALSELSYRTKLLATELRRVARRELSLRGFLAGRGVAQRFRWARDRKLFARGKLPVLPFETRDALYVNHLVAAARTYDPPRQPGPVLVFHRADQPRGRFLDPSFGWGALVDGTLEVYGLPGDHLGIFEDPGAEIMARHLAAAMR